MTEKLIYILYKRNVITNITNMLRIFKRFSKMLHRLLFHRLICLNGVGYHRRAFSVTTHAGVFSLAVFTKVSDRTTRNLSVTNCLFIGCARAYVRAITMLLTVWENMCVPTKTIIVVNRLVFSKMSNDDVLLAVTGVCYFKCEKKQKRIWVRRSLKSRKNHWVIGFLNFFFYFKFLYIHNPWARRGDTSFSQ